MKINEIKKVKNGKYKIVIDGENFFTYDDVIIKNNLIYKNQIDASLFEQIKKDHEYYDAYNKILSFTLKKIRSKEEVEKYLEKFSIDKNLKTKIINHLISIGLLSDLSYIRAYISDSIHINMDGPNKIKEFLLSMNLDENDIDNELAKIESDIILNNLNKLINKKIRTNHKLSNVQLQKKIVYDMNQKGYSFSDINNALSEYTLTDDEELLKKEFEKIYCKLSKKYAGYELSNKVKQNLYSKGFDLNEIKILLEKKEE